MRIVLASASPRRRELLGQIGLEFEVLVSNVEERVTADGPGAMVEELSARKAMAVMGALGRTAEDVLVVGADTVVTLDGRIMGKPSDSGDAAGMLGMLSGRTHEVYTGVALLYRAAGREPGECERRVFHEVTRVSLYPMSEAEIAFYVSSGDCMDKAGAYGIQGLFARYVKGIEGDYNNVVGLPVGRLYQEAGEWLRDEKSSDF